MTLYHMSQSSSFPSFHEEAGMLFGLTQNGKVFFHAKADGTVFVRPGVFDQRNGWQGDGKTGKRGDGSNVFLFFSSLFRSFFCFFWMIEL